jgi:hypothetical protein
MKGSQPTALLEIVRGEATRAALPVPLDPPDANGRIQQVFQLPVEGLDAGDYALRLTVSQGTRREIREARVTVVD